tara:strand:+ start:648 stop:770 length:123 start_codon:yes stop_codon:yes gene_type:complete
MLYRKNTYATKKYGLTKFEPVEVSQLFKDLGGEMKKIFQD